MSPTTNALDLGQRLTSEVLEPMKHVFVGKDEIIDLMGVCLVGGENLFLLGPPGTAKTALVHELGRRIDGRTFDYLLTRFTEPNEIFGPFDIRKLREGDLITNTEGMLPEASLVFLDELLNANSAILNSLLAVLNERVFRRGRETRSLPTLMVIGASNRLPDDDALNALFDRFLLRVTCNNVPGERLGEVLAAGWQLDSRKREKKATLSVDDIVRLNSMLAEVDLSAVRAPVITLVERLRKAGIAVSDRRAVKLQRLVAASALLCARKAAQVSDVWVFKYIWDTLEQQEVIASLVEDILKHAPADTRDHPRARSSNAPDPEAINRDFDAIASRLADKSTTAADRASLRDRLSVLVARAQWVAAAESRAFLAKRADELWKLLDGAEPVLTNPPSSKGA
ncbi:MAG TPA: AAA family ATPase [Planctomycetota bacterium]|nr:AAA family ATPase [Planctomycetota bacterium]